MITYNNVKIKQIGDISMAGFMDYENMSILPNNLYEAKICNDICYNEVFVLAINMENALIKLRKKYSKDTKVDGIYKKLDNNFIIQDALSNNQIDGLVLYGADFCFSTNPEQVISIHILEESPEKMLTSFSKTVADAQVLNFHIVASNDVLVV